MFEFQVDGPFGCGEDDLLDFLAARNLVDLRDVLRKHSESKLQETSRVHIPDERICLRRLGRVHGDWHAIRGYEPHGRSGTSPHLGYE